MTGTPPAGTPDPAPRPVAWHRRLSTTIFAAVLGSLVVCALAVALAGRLHAGREAAALGRAFSPEIVEDVNAALPGGAPAVHQVLQRWQDIAPVSLAVLAADGSVVAQAGRRPGDTRRIGPPPAAGFGLARDGVPGPEPERAPASGGGFGPDGVPGSEGGFGPERVPGSEGGFGPEREPGSASGSAPEPAPRVAPGPDRGPAAMPPLPSLLPLAPDGPGSRRRGPLPRPARFDLDAGHRLLVLPDPVRLRDLRPGWLVQLGLLVAAVALVAWPLSRRITRRLERLQRGVEQVGHGRFDATPPDPVDDEVGRLARSVAQAAGRIESLLAAQAGLLRTKDGLLDAQRRLLAHVSHELRSPLSRIRMAVALLDGPAGPVDPSGPSDPSGPADPAGARGSSGSPDPAGPSGPAAHRREIARSVDELDALVEEILQSSRLHVQPPEQAAVDLLGLVAEEAARVGAELHADGPAAVSGDMRLLRRALRNLLENAVRYHPPDAAAPVTVVLSAMPAPDAAPALAPPQRLPAVPPPGLPARPPPGLPAVPPGPGWRVEVLDRGPGVAAAERERVFEPFHRIEGHRESQGNVGLGLSLARQIAQAHRGRAYCTGRDGGGARFVLELPASAGVAYTDPDP